MSRSSLKSVFALLTITIVAVAAVVMADASPANDYVRVYDQNGTLVVIPKVQIINWDDTVARFDSSDGSIYRFNGNLESRDVRGQWVKSVPGVSGASGALQIQNPDGVENLGATFLVDTISGRTWILQRPRRTRNTPTNGTWDEVKKFR